MGLAFTRLVLFIAVAAQTLTGFAGAVTAVCIGEHGAKLEAQTLGGSGCGCRGEHVEGAPEDPAEDEATGTRSHCSHAGCQHHVAPGSSRTTASRTGRNTEEPAGIDCDEGRCCGHDCACTHVELPSDKPATERFGGEAPELERRVSPSVEPITAGPTLCSGRPDGAKYSSAPPGRSILFQLSTLILRL